MPFVFDNRSADLADNQIFVRNSISARIVLVQEG